MNPKMNNSLGCDSPCSIRVDIKPIRLALPCFMASPRGQGAMHHRGGRKSRSGDRWEAKEIVQDFG